MQNVLPLSLVCQSLVYTGGGGVEMGGATFSLSSLNSRHSFFCDGFSCTLNKFPVWIDGNVSASVPACFPRHAKQSKASLGFWFQRSLTGSRSGLAQSCKTDSKKKKISSTDDRIDVYFLDGSRYFLLQCVVGFWLLPADNCDVSLPKEYTSSSAHTYTQTHTHARTHTQTSIVVMAGCQQ